MLVHKERLTGTAASGSLTLTTAKFSGVLCNRLSVKPATATTTYTITLTDSNADQVLKQEAVQGQLDLQLSEPLRGNYSLAITSASADEAFTAVFMVRENA